MKIGTAVELFVPVGSSRDVALKQLTPRWMASVLAKHDSAHTFSVHSVSLTVVESATRSGVGTTGSSHPTIKVQMFVTHNSRGAKKFNIERILRPLSELNGEINQRTGDKNGEMTIVCGTY